ncbi:L-threonylcarbamoyladenylate synthase [Patescibacteria group bacterium]
MNNEIKKAVEILKSGGVIAYPTDTVYGLGANIFDKKAVLRVSKLKKRDAKKPVLIAVSGLEMLKQFAQVNTEQEELIKQLLPGPVAMLLAKTDRVPDYINEGQSLIGIRWSNDPISAELINSAGFPITSTSVNIEGKSPAKSQSDINLPVDSIVSGECEYRTSSTMVDMVSKKIVRPGAKYREVKKLLAVTSP